MSHDFDAIRARHSLIDVAQRYTDLNGRGGEYAGLCPLHAERTPSFTVFKHRDGSTYRWRCFVCATGGDVVDLVREVEGCTPREAIERLDGGRIPPIGSRPVLAAQPPDRSDEWTPVVPAPDDAPAYDPARTFNPRRGKQVRYQPERCDAYRDAYGRVLCHVVRLVIEGKKLTPTITWCTHATESARWCAKRMPAPYPLHGLDDLAARPDARVLVVSGEKCREAAALHLPAFVAVSWLGGDGSVDSIDVEPLRDRNVTYWPDADPSGREAMHKLCNRVG